MDVLHSVIIKRSCEQIPEVDVIIGTMSYEALNEAIDECLLHEGETKECLESIDYLPKPLHDRDSMSGGYFAYLKIAEGIGCMNVVPIASFRKFVENIAVWQWKIFLHRHDTLLTTVRKN